MKYFFVFIFFINSAHSMTLPGTLSMVNQATKEDQELNDYLAEFPEIFYKICEVENLGLFYVDSIPDGIKGHLRQGIYWESGIGELVRKYAKPNTVAIDLGAHIGIHTITMSKKVGNNGLVVAFEPQRKIYRELINNLTLNQCDHNVIALPYAVGEKEKTIEMSPPNLFNEGGIPVGKGGNKAKMVTLDSLQLENVSFIKMDVESYELKVLKGARSTLLRNKPVIVFEILGGYDLNNPTKEIKKVSFEILRFLRQLNYRVTRIHGNDFIAIPNSKR